MMCSKQARIVTIVLSFAVLPLGVARADGQRVFPSAEAATEALVAAARAGDRAGLEAIFGPDSHDLFFSGDDVADLRNLARFSEWADERTALETNEDGSVEVVVGEEDWPLPMPLVKSADGWRFDTEAGKDELINRRIGANELSTIDVCRGFVDAQAIYASKDRDGDGATEFATKILSDDGKQNGLFWNASKHAGEASPIGPLAATAAGEGYKRSENANPAPYHGYFFRMLTKQGASAPGGKRDYVVDGNMTGGFAVLAHPAEYGSSGIMTFMINRHGILFQKDLGDGTAKSAAAIDSYDPDLTWSVVED
jgi:hypothetical protein